jgi:hypothetical protein
MTYWVGVLLLCFVGIDRHCYQVTSCLIIVLAQSLMEGPSPGI